MNQEFTLIKMSFPGGIHLSTGKSDYTRNQDILHSDSIKSALFASLVAMGEENHEWMDQLELSSAFPFWKNQLYFPVPLSGADFRLLDYPEGNRHRKEVKKIKWIDHSLFEEILKGNEVQVRELDGKPTYSPAYRLKKGNFVFSNSGDYPSKLIIRSTSQKVTIPKRSNPSEQDATPYYIEEMRFPNSGGLFFLVRWKGSASEKDKKLFKGAVRLLGDQGIGAARSRGFGQFVFEEEQNFRLRVPDQASHAMGLSLCSPDIESDRFSMEDLTESAYNLIKRGGYISTRFPEKGLRKRSAYFFTEGSVFPAKVFPKGKLLDLNPNPGAPGTHPVYREGRPLTIPILPSKQK